MGWSAVPTRHVDDDTRSDNRVGDRGPRRRVMRDPAASDPVMGREEAQTLGARILGMLSSDRATIEIVHMARGVTRVAQNQVRSGNEGEQLTLAMSTTFGRLGPVQLKFNQLDDATLRGAIAQLEALARQAGPPLDPPKIAGLAFGPQHYPPVSLWHDDTAALLGERRTSVLPPVVEALRNAKVIGSAFIGAMARSTLIMRKDGLIAYEHETDSEITVTAWNADGKGSGWAGATARDWTRVDPNTVVTRALDITRRAANPVSVEPGRMTTIMSGAAVAQLLQNVDWSLDAYRADQWGPMNLRREKSKLGMRVMDPRITLSSDPADPDGGYFPFFTDTTDLGLPLTKMTWIRQGVLENLAYDPMYAAQKGKTPYNDTGHSFRMASGETTVDQMIANCERGVYVNRFFGIETIDWNSGMMTGTTHDGCFLIRNGKLERSINNLRFVDTPFHFLNRLEAIGLTERQSMGYSPVSFRGVLTAIPWPRPPMIVPPLMIRDFNFVALADLV